ncbi:MAG: adenylate kinase [Clostridia bacterium]|nr:adenylate kinase [Clostridia bacterium]
MIILITGASHTGKTALAQKLLEKYKYPYLSIDHLKMGLIRSGNTELTPLSDDSALTEYLWPIVREMIKTAIENKQNLIVEGCYIPFNWQEDFDKEYLDHIKYYCLVMSENYIRNHFDDIKKFASVIEKRIDDDCSVDGLLQDNSQVLNLCKKHTVNYVLIDDEYKINIDL